MTLKLNLNNWWAIFELPMLDDSTPLELVPDESQADKRTIELRQRDRALNLTAKTYVALKITHKEK